VVGEDAAWQDLVAIDEESLRPVVEDAVGRSLDSLGPWSEEIITGGGGRSPGIRRFTGTGQTASGEVRWSIVLKCLASSTGGDEPDSWNSWRREADAYESGFLDALPGGAVAPRCFAIEGFAPGLVGLWLEDLGRPDEWPSAADATIARALGELNGAESLLVPDPPTWMSRNWLRNYVENAAPWIDVLQRSGDQPAVAMMFPPDHVAAILELWKTRGHRLDVLSMLPQGICHMDAHRRNQFPPVEHNGEDRCTMIDWAFTGPGALGEELAPMVIATASLSGMDVEESLTLEGIVFGAYLEGLSASGRSVDPREVRLGYSLTAGLRFLLGTLDALLPPLLDTREHTKLEEVFGAPLSIVSERVTAKRTELLFPLCDEADRLIDELGV
jgi:hypothetical protein